MITSIKIKSLIVTVAAAFGLLIALPTAASVSADHEPGHTDTTTTTTTGGSTEDAKGEACEAIEALGEKCDEAAEGSVVTTIKNIINILSWIIGVASVVIFIIGGMRFVLSGGNSDAVQSARGSMIYAIIGLVIVAFAQTIVAFVLNRL